MDRGPPRGRLSRNPLPLARRHAASPLTPATPPVPVPKIGKGSSRSSVATGSRAERSRGLEPTSSLPAKKCPADREGWIPAQRREGGLPQSRPPHRPSPLKRFLRRSPCGSAPGGTNPRGDETKASPGGYHRRRRPASPVSHRAFPDEETAGGMRRFGEGRARGARTFVRPLSVVRDLESAIG